MSSSNVKQKMNAIQAFVFDIDGVLTDGCITMHSDDTVSRNFFAKDGYAIQHALKAGYRVAIISAAREEILRTRFLRIGMQEVYLGTTNKETTLKEFAVAHNLSHEQILFMGDDLPDLVAMKLAGIAACPNDACSEIRAISHYVSPKEGGKGCVRDVIEQVMRLHSKW